jgi:tetratricopeptide (TPR) repeat protein
MAPRPSTKQKQKNEPKHKHVILKGALASCFICYVLNFQPPPILAKTATHVLEFVSAKLCGPTAQPTPLPSSPKLSPQAQFFGVWHRPPNMTHFEAKELADEAANHARRAFVSASWSECASGYREAIPKYTGLIDDPTTPGELRLDCLASRADAEFYFERLLTEVDAGARIVASLRLATNPTSYRAMATADYDEYLPHRPDDAVAWRQAGELEYRDQNYGEAKLNLENAVRCNPADLGARASLADTCARLYLASARRQHEYRDDAIKHYHQLVKKEFPGRVRALIELAWLEIDSGNVAAAKLCYVSANKLNCTATEKQEIRENMRNLSGTKSR